MNDPESYVKKHRQQLLSELVYMVERWKDAGMPLAETNTRFNKRTGETSSVGFYTSTVNLISWITPMKRPHQWTTPDASSQS